MIIMLGWETEQKSNYVWSTYILCYGSDHSLKKYNYNVGYGTVDDKTVLDEKDDVAHVKLGGTWRMPTDAEWTELRENCTWTWTVQNGVNGKLCTSKNNGNSIFIPAAGHRGGIDLLGKGYQATYWSSSLDMDYPGSALLFGYYETSDVYRTSYPRSAGHSIRPVTE